MSRSSIESGLRRLLLPLRILDLLEERSGHGLELAELIGAEVWCPGASTLYPTLRRLESEGLIEGELQESRAAPRRVYTLTYSGLHAREEMRDRIRSELESVRDLADASLAALDSTGSS